jgi:hypothetical protein
MKRWMKRYRENGLAGLEKRVARAPQLYSRIGFNHEMEPLSDDEMRFFLDQRWSH